MIRCFLLAGECRFIWGAVRPVFLQRLDVECDERAFAEMLAQSVLDVRGMFMGVVEHQLAGHAHVHLDGDGVSDKEDRCPTVKGTIANKGCPEMAKEDVKKITK